MLGSSFMWDGISMLHFFSPTNGNYKAWTEYVEDDLKTVESKL